MDRDIVEFGSDELRIVGGDYGQLHLEGTTEEARRACDALVAATRRGGDRAFIDSCIACVDDSPDQLPLRDAGRAGTPQGGPDSTDDEGGVESSSGERRVEGDE